MSSINQYTDYTHENASMLALTMTTGARVYVRENKIVGMLREGSETIIHVLGSAYRVKETPEEIIKLSRDLVARVS